MDSELWFNKATISINQKVIVGRVFEVKDLFESVEWKELSKGDMIRFGKDFANAVREGQFPNVERVIKGDNNHSRYIKTG